MKKVAITGALASGKSTLCRLLEELGGYYVSADELVHELLSPQTPLGQQVIQLLGEEVLVGDRFDKEAVANKVFEDPRLLEELEKILHPAVRKEIEKHYRQTHTSPLFIVEIPLLFETGFDQEYDVTVAVVTNKRFSERADDAKRKRRQLSQEEKAKRADFIIENNGTLEDLKRAAKQLYQELNANND